MSEIKIPYFFLLEGETFSFFFGHHGQHNLHDVTNLKFALHYTWDGWSIVSPHIDKNSHFKHENFPSAQVENILENYTNAFYKILALSEIEKIVADTLNMVESNYTHFDFVDMKPSPWVRSEINKYLLEQSGEITLDLEEK